MNHYSLTHVSDPALLRELRTLVAQDRATTALLLAHLAEVDARRLYAPAGYPSMFAWCVEKLHLSEEAAFKRIRAARVARQCPAVFALVADGRLHLSAVVMLAAHLTPENAEELLEAAAHQSKVGIEQLLAERFPRPDLPGRIEALAPAPAVRQLPRGQSDRPGTSWPRCRASPRTSNRPRGQSRRSGCNCPRGQLHPLRPGGTPSSSPGRRTRTRSCVTPRRCSATRSPPVSWPRCSTAHWMP